MAVVTYKLAILSICAAVNILKDVMWDSQPINGFRHNLL